MELEHEPTAEQIIDEMQISATEFARLQQLPATLSLEQQLFADEQDDRRIGELLADVSAPSPEEVVVRSFFADDVQRILAEILSPRELRVIELRFGMGMDEEQTLVQAGRELSVTRERVRQIEKQAIQKLRASPNVSALWK